MRMLGLDRRDVHSAIRATLCVSVFVARRTVRGFRHPNAAMTARKYRPCLDGAPWSCLDGAPWSRVALKLL